MVLNAYEVIGLLAFIFAVVPFPSISNYTPYFFVVAKHARHAKKIISAWINGSPQVIESFNGYDKIDFDSLYVRGIPPGWVFGVVWTICYGLLISSSFVFLLNFSTSGLWTAWYIVLIGHISMLRLWPSVFYGSESIRGMWASLGVVLLAWFSSGALLIFYAIEGAWVSFGLFVFNVLWLTYATYLNAQFSAKSKLLLGMMGYDAYLMMERANLVTRRIDVKVNSFNGRRV